MENHYFNQFSKVNEAVQPESLKPDELVLLDNMRLDDAFAAAVSRKGFDRYNQQVNSNGVITSLFDVEDADGNNQLLAQVGTVLRKSLNGSGAYSTIKSGLTNAKMRMAIYGDNFFFTNGNEEPFYSDLTAANTYDLSLETPDITNITFVNNSIDPNPLVYTHRRFLIVYITDDGQSSNPSIYFETRKFENLEESGTREYVFSGLPVPSDSRIITKKIYRTKANELNNFYLLATLEAATTTFTDTVFDSALLIEDAIEYITPIDWSKYITTNAERIFLGNITKSYTNRITPPGFSSETNITQVPAGNVADGTYYWGISYLDQEGNESALTFAVTDTVSAGPKKVTIRDICMPITRRNGTTGDVTFNDSIKSVKLYRTKVGTTSPYYFVTEQDVADVTLNNLDYIIDDDIADGSLGAEYPTASSKATDSVNLKSAIIFSNLYSPLEFPELNLIQVYPDDNDPITGIFDDDNGIIVFKERSICKLYTNGDPTNWQTSKLVTDVGCDEPNSIYKYGDVYYFFYKKRPYLFDGRSAINIGESIRNTFDSITSVKGATFWHDSQYYIMAVTIGSDYYLMIYDTKLKGWYKWSISKADAIITKQFGADKDKILFGRNTYVTYYNEAIDYDNDTGSRVDFVVRLKTKDYRVDGFVNQRLWMLYLDYRKRLNRTNDYIIFTLTDPDKPSTTLNYNDSSSAVVRNRFKIPTDAMIGIMKRARIINFSFTGVSMDQFVNGRLDYMPEVWGVERRDSGEITGWGTSVGTEAGKNTT